MRRVDVRTLANAMEYVVRAGVRHVTFERDGAVKSYSMYEGAPAGPPAIAGDDPEVWRALVDDGVLLRWDDGLGWVQDDEDLRARETMPAPPADPHPDLVPDDESSAQAVARELALLTPSDRPSGVARRAEPHITNEGMKRALASGTRQQKLRFDDGEPFPPYRLPDRWGR